MENDLSSKGFPDSEYKPITVEKIMRSLTTPDYPNYIAKLLKQVKNWIAKPHKLDDYDLPYWEVLHEAPEMLFDDLTWVEEYAALLPSDVPPKPMPEAVVLTLGEADLTNAMRLAVDYGLIFSKRACRRVWIVTDCWIPFDVLEYADHIKAMLENGVSLRFLLSSLWGWVELPVSAIGDLNIRGTGLDENRGRFRRRSDDD